MRTFRSVRVLLSSRIAPAVLLLFALLSANAVWGQTGGIITFSAADGDADLNYTQTSITRTVGSTAFTFSGGSLPDKGLGYDTTYAPGGIYAFDGTNGNNVKLTISAPNNYIFDLSSFQAEADTGSIGVVLTYADGSTASFTTTAPSGSIVTLNSFATPITNVKQVVLSSDLYGVFQDFDIVNIRTPPPVPTATTGSADSITATAATLHGTVNDNGDPTTASFQYGTMTSHDVTVSASPGSIASGSGNTSVSTTLTGLVCNTTYFYRVLARNGGGATPGSDGTFTTAACAPTATTGSASNITQTGAKLGGTISSNGAATAAVFEYGTSTSYGSTATAIESPLSSTASGAAVSAQLSGLTCNTTYHFRVKGVNSAGATYGGDGSFTTTACAPSATTGSASSISATGASLAGTVADNGATTTVSFEYGTTTGYGTSVSATPSAVSAGAGSTAVSAAVSGLSCNTTYHFRVKGVNSAGTTNGSDASFTTTACAPTVTTGSASNITQTGAKLGGTISANGAATTVGFDYGTSTSYGSTAGAAENPLSGMASSTAVSVLISGLSCNTTYHFRVRGVNSVGATYGGDGSFTTAACAPTATTGSASSISSTGASLAGTVADNGAATAVSFEYGTTTGYGTLVAATPGSVAAGAGVTAVTAAIGGLSCNTTYHFRVKGVNSSASAYGSDGSFTTSACLPGAPTIGTATSGDSQATITFSAPGSNGGATITGYTVTSNPGGITGTGGGSPITVTGLTNGTAYTFTVTASNSAGTGPASTASNSVRPKANQTITFDNPGVQSFGTTPTLAAISNSGLTVSFTSSTTGVCTITTGGALTFVSTGTCTINADQAGNGTYFAATTVSRSFAVNAVVPGAPSIGTATAGDAQASVSFMAPAFTGGASITSYTVTSNPGGVTGTRAASPITVTGLTNGTAYTFTVTATNSAGTGSASAASNSVMPKGPQTITFANPGAQSFGTTPTLTAISDSGLTVSFTSSTTGVCTITTGGALTFVSAGTCTINADQAGNGLFAAAPTVTRSFAVNAVVPGAPTIGAATASDGQASVSFSAPSFTGGTTVTGYTVTSSPGGLTGTGSASPIAVTGLTNGTPYTFTVKASNSVGTGPTSAASNSVTPNPPMMRTVTNNNDSGAGSLRQMLADANPGDTISFDASLNGQTITLLSPIVISRAVTISGPGAANLTISGNQSVRLFEVTGGATFTLQNLTLADGIAPNGAALADSAGTSTTISRCVFRGNSASGNGGAIAASGTMTIGDTLLTGNSAVYGGAIYAGSADMTLSNVTIAANTATTAGGGIYQNGGTTLVFNATIAANTAAVAGGGIAAASGVFNLKNSIVASNVASTGPDLNGNINSQGYNLVKDAAGSGFSSSTGDVIGQDPALGALADNGGATHTFALLSTSPAINAVPSGTNGCGTTLTADQRGMARPQGSSCDMGAYERGLPATLTAIAGTPQTAAAGSAFATQLQTKVVDSFGIPLDGVAVNFAGPMSGASITSGGSVQTNASGVASYAITANLAGGSYTVTATVDSLSASYSLTNLQLAQSIGSISFAPGTMTVGGNTTVSASASSSLPVVFSSASPAVCTVSGTTVTAIATGTCTILASQAGNATYSAATEVAGNIAVSKVSQTIGAITFTPVTLTVGGSSVVSATATSGLAVTFSSATPAVCTVSGTTVIGVATGTCTIRANQAGNATYSAATEVACNIAVNKVSQTIGAITFTPVTLTVGGSSVVSATATSGLAVAFSSATPAVCTVSGTTVSGVATGTCTILANQAGNATCSAATEVAGSIAVSKATQTIGNLSFSPATLTVGGTTTAAASASSGLPVDFASATPTVCSVSGATVRGLAVGTCTITATQVGDSNYTAATFSRDLSVTYADAPPALTVSALSDGATTATSTQNISGKATDPSGIRSVTVNGTTVSVSSDGSFTYPVQLIAGQNTITVIATNNAGISATDTRRITLDSTYPLLSVTYPADNATLVKPVVTVTGTVESLLNAAVKTGVLHANAVTDSNVTVTYSVNDSEPQTAVVSGGNYTFTADLGSGMNTVRVFASTTEGRKVEAKRTISYAPGFTLTVTNPAEDARTPLSRYTLTGAVADNDTPVTISIAVDGKTFTPRVTNGIFQQELSFAEARVYPVTITGVDQNGTTVTVVRNIIRSASSEGTSTTFTIEDALLAMKMALGIVPSTASEVLRLDVAPMVNGVSFGDGRIDIEDAAVILRIATGSLQ